jgi:hypothetical protein
MNLTGAASQGSGNVRHLLSPLVTWSPQSWDAQAVGSWAASPPQVIHQPPPADKDLSQVSELWQVYQPCILDTPVFPTSHQVCGRLAPKPTVGAAAGQAALSAQSSPGLSFIVNPSLPLPFPWEGLITKPLDTALPGGVPASSLIAHAFPCKAAIVLTGLP